MVEVIGTMKGRLASERGSVGVIVAFVIFVVMGMLTMTWNTAELSKAKMRLQNAADSAALAHAVWQARGMNAVQNINDEMYEALSLASKLRAISAGFESAAIFLDNLACIPIVGPFCKAAAIVAIILTLGNAAQAPWNYGWDNPQDEYAKFHQQQEDSVNMLSPIQAENVTDSLLAPKSDDSKYYE